MPQGDSGGEGEDDDMWWLDHLHEMDITLDDEYIPSHVKCEWCGVPISFEELNDSDPNDALHYWKVSYVEDSDAEEDRIYCSQVCKEKDMLFTTNDPEAPDVRPRDSDEF